MNEETLPPSPAEKKKSNRLIPAVAILASVAILAVPAYTTFRDLFITGTAVSESGLDKTELIANLDELINGFDSEVGNAIDSQDYESAALYLQDDPQTDRAVNTTAMDLARVFANQPLGRDSVEQQIPGLAMDVAVAMYSLTNSVSDCAEDNLECQRLAIERNYPAYKETLAAYKTGRYLSGN